MSRPIEAQLSKIGGILGRSSSQMYYDARRVGAPAPTGIVGSCHVYSLAEWRLFLANGGSTTADAVPYASLRPVVHKIAAT